MTPEDRKRLKDAFMNAVAKSPAADTPVEGMAKPDGSPVTHRQLIEATVNNEQFYQQIDRVVASGKKTIDEVVEDFGKMKFPLKVRRAARPPKPRTPHQ